VTERFRSQNSDYLKSGYDRGHLAAAGNHRSSQKLVDQTFYLSNMAPQVGVGFNRDAWCKLERYVRRLTRTYDNVYCCTGPLYLPRYVRVVGHERALFADVTNGNVNVNFAGERLTARVISSMK
jgi:DNA/RNA endonuclease G (NUC1)